jgi:hypothetical protein
VVGKRLVALGIFGFRQRHHKELFPPQHPEGVMPDDAPQPARKCRRLRERRQSRPGSDKSLLNDIFGLLEIADLGKRRAEGEMLEAARQVDKGLDVASNSPANQLFVIHRHALSPVRCRERQPAFGKKYNNRGRGFRLI